MATSPTCKVLAISAFYRSNTQTPLHNQLPSRYLCTKPFIAILVPKLVAMATSLSTSGPPSNTIPWAHPSPQPKWHLDRFSRFCRAHWCDRPTDHATRSITTGRIYVCSTVMWPKNYRLFYTVSHKNTYVILLL